MQTYGTFALPTPEAEVVNLYALSKTSLETTDDSLLETVESPKTGDIAVITTTIEDVEYQKSSYMYSGSGWEALNGNVEADKVILTSNITMAGNYTQVGNLTKTQTGTATFQTQGKTLMEALTEIFSKRLQPTITANPSLGNVTISQTGNVECGTTIPSMTVNQVTFNSGSYTYGPATGVTVNTWTTERISNNGTVQLSGVGTGGAITDNNSGAGFMMGDQTGDFSTLSYRVTAQYGDGVAANDNLGSESSPVVKINAGSTNKTSGSVTAFRKYFYGTSTNSVATPDNAFIRSLTGSTGACSNGKTFSITIPDGTKTVCIAYPATFRDLTNVLDTGAFGTDIVASFTKTLVDVEGANGYTAIQYKVFTYTPAAALGANTYNVTI